MEYLHLFLHKSKPFVINLEWNTVSQHRHSSWRFLTFISCEIIEFYCIKNVFSPFLIIMQIFGFPYETTERFFTSFHKAWNGAGVVLSNIVSGHSCVQWKFHESCTDFTFFRYRWAIAVDCDIRKGNSTVIMCHIRIKQAVIIWGRHKNY